MFDSLMLVLLLSSGQVPDAEPIPVESTVISLIEDRRLSFDATGVIREVAIQRGSMVEKGDLLAELDTTDADLEIRRVEVELNIAQLNAENRLSIELSEKALSVALTELERALKANEKFAETVSASEIDRLKLTRDEAQLKIQQAKFELKQRELEVQLKEAELAIATRKKKRQLLRSPFSGMIVQVEHQAGEWARPDQLFCRIIRTDRMHAEGLVSMKQPRVEIGQKATIIHEETKTPLIGRVTFVDPEIDSITEKYRVVAEFPNTDGLLRPGQRPQMMIDLSPPSEDTEKELTQSVRQGVVE